MKMFIYLSLLIASSAFANAIQSGNSEPQTCITKEEQSRLSLVLIREAEKIAAHPDCVNYWGAPACLSPLDSARKRNILNKIKNCAQAPDIEISYEEVDSKVCLNKTEQLILGQILVEEAAEMEANPKCVEFQGAAGCLKPFSDVMKNELLRQVKECK